MFEWLIRVAINHRKSKNLKKEENFKEEKTFKKFCPEASHRGI